MKPCNTFVARWPEPIPAYNPTCLTCGFFRRDHPMPIYGPPPEKGKCLMCGCAEHGVLMVETYDKIQAGPSCQSAQDGQVAEGNSRAGQTSSEETQEKELRELWNGLPEQYLDPRLGIANSEEAKQMMGLADNPILRESTLEELREALAPIRQFSTGATRDVDTDKLKYEGFLSPFVLEEYAKYMHRHRVQADGSLRDPDNWQKGIPQEAYADSLVRHVMEFWQMRRDPDGYDGTRMKETLCAILFNAMGYLFEDIKGKK